MKRLIVGITGASAVVYGVRLLEVLAKREDIEIHLTISSSGARALWEELKIEVDINDFKLQSLIGIDTKQIIYHHESDIGASIASGSFRTEGMIVVPCSMGTVASIAAHAETVTRWCVRVTCNARILPFPEISGRSDQLRCDKDSGSV